MKIQRKTSFFMGETQSDRSGQRKRTGTRYVWQKYGKPERSVRNLFLAGESRSRLEIGEHRGIKQTEAAISMSKEVAT